MAEEEEHKVPFKKLVALLAFFILYLFLGSVMFHFLETDQERENRNKILEAKAKVLEEHPCLNGDVLEDLVQVTVETISSGVDPLGNSTNPTNWDYASAFFFSGTVVTTIGYGKHVPVTDLGRNMCLLYALIGIPFTGWLLSTVGKFYQSSFEHAASVIEDFLQNTIRCKGRRLRKLLLYIVVFLLSYGIFVLFPASWFYLMEHWTFEQAHYYAFITLSTIGFGDFVASADSQHPKNQKLLWLYDIAVACWYVFGLSYLAVIITVVGQEQKHTLTRIRKKIKKGDSEPPFGITLADVEAETSFNHECTCKHRLNFKHQGTQTV